MGVAFLGFTQHISMDEAENSLAALTTPTPEPFDRSPRSRLVDYFLENVYGSLFAPQATFTYLRSNPSVIAGGLVVVLVNALEVLRLGQQAWNIPLSVSIGLVGWLIFAGLLRLLTQVLGRTISLKVLLTLIGFGSTPWLFIAPALSVGGAWSRLLAIVVMGWFVVWQVWATSIALEVNRWRLLLLVPLTIFGGFVALLWTGNVFKLLFSIANS